MGRQAKERGLKHYTHNSIHLITPFDSGGSSAVIRRTFRVLSVGDIRNTRIIGAGNYQQLAGNNVFWQALRNTLYFAFVGGPLTIFIALAAALLLNSKLARFKAVFRTIYFAPVVTTIVAVAVVWRYLYHPRVGLLNLAEVLE